MAPGLPRLNTKHSPKDNSNISSNNSLNRSTLIGCLIDRAIVNTADVAQIAADTDVKQSFAGQLSLWLDWTDAIALSAALNANGAMPDRPFGKPHSAIALIAELQRARGDLAQSIRADDLPDGASDHGALDFSPYRRIHRAHQQAMETRIGALRMQARAVLSGLSVALHRLAALDAVLHHALAAKERHVLATLPGLMEKHFNRLRTAHAANPAQSPDWLAVFCGDRQAALLAELDFRLHAVEGMVDALPNSSTRPS